MNSGGGGYPLNIGPLSSQNWQQDMEFYNGGSGGGDCSKALDCGRIPFSGRSGNHIQKLGVIGDTSGGLTIYTCLGDLGNRNNIKMLDDKNTRLNYAYKVGMYIGSDFCPSDKGGLKIIFIGDYSDKIVDTTTKITELNCVGLEKIIENNGSNFIDWWSVDNLPLN